MKATVNKIYNFITKLILLLEKELDELKNGKNTITTQKNIMHILNKLVALLTQLNKLKKEETSEQDESLSDSDQDILNKYVEKIKMKK